MKGLLKRIKNIHLKDITDVFVSIVFIPIAYICKIFLYKKEIWIIAEDNLEARDNAYHLFKYIRVNNPDINAYYVIDKRNPDYDKVKEYGNIIQPYGIRHWVYYICAKYIIVTHKHGSPSASVFYILHILGMKKKSRIFLEHGITMNNVSYLNYNKTKFRLFICGAKPEYEYVKNNFGYPNENVTYLGFSRFDNLYNIEINSKQIVIMPTWRSYLRNLSSIEFINTLYYKTYFNLLNNLEFINYIEENNITVYFYLHRNMQKFTPCFYTNSKNIIIDNNIDIQYLLTSSSLLVTDYSSVSLDFAYMEKPLIYYQFDKEIFMSNHLDSGYFSYDKDGFGPVLSNEEDVVNRIIGYISDNYKLEKKYKNKINNFFTIHDNNNSSRIVEFLKRM